MMFHVKLQRTIRCIKGMTAIIVVLCSLSACVGSRPAVQITDYVVLPDGIENLGGAPLSAFIFENNLRNQSIERFLNSKFKTDTYSDKEFWIPIGGEKFKLILYDNAEFEKFFSDRNFVVSNLDPANVQTGTQRKFVAISLVTERNEDALKETSLYYNISTNYLKALKDEYYYNGNN